MSDKYKFYDVVLDTEIVADGVYARSWEEAVDMIEKAIRKSGAFDVEVLDIEVHCYEDDDD